MSNEPDNVNSGALATIIVLVALSTLAVALVVTALVRQETSRLRAEGDAAQDRAFRQLRSEQEGKLNDSPAWVDKEAGLASIPIESAMDLVIESVRRNPLELSPGNEPEEEEEEEETTDEDDEAGQEAADAEGDEAADEDAEAESDPAAGPSPKKAPAPPAPKLSPKAPTEPKPSPAPATHPQPAPRGASE